MTVLLSPSEPLPQDPLGSKLCGTFPYLWKALLKSNEPTGTWETLDKYPLRPRVLWRYWQDAAFVVGVRFGAQTGYGLIDLDAESEHHPNQNPHALNNIRAALETIGICRTVLTRSSHSGGLHLWLPLEGTVPSFWLATALKVCLEQHGFALKQGQLETFPNCKSYSPQGQPPSEYHGHRLPLQPASGAALLDAEGQVVPGELGTFFSQWDVAAAAQDSNLLTAKIALARELQSKRRYRSTHAVIKEWREDLETELRDGWTGHGQTNHLLKTIACYGIVFAGQSQAGLVPYIVRTAIALPGYQEWCQHQTHIEQRAQDWAKAAASYYWTLGTQGCRAGVFHQTIASNNIVSLNRNQARAADAQQRIQQAVETLVAAHALPDTISQRMVAIVAIAHCSRQTLRKAAVLPLWHPEYQQECGSKSCATAVSAVITPETGTLQPACTTDQERDRRLEADRDTDRLKTHNPHEKGFVHTCAPQMKGGMPTVNGSEKALQPTSPATPRSANTESVTVGVAREDPITPTEMPSGRSPQGVSVTVPGAKIDTSDQDGNGYFPQGERAQTPVSPAAPRTPRAILPPSTTPPARERGQNPTSQQTPRAATTPPELLKPRKRKRIVPLAEQVLPPHAVLIAPTPVYHDIAPDEVRRVTEAISQVLQQLQHEHGWTAKDLTLWLAQQFAGRRRSQIPDRELPVLLARLQAYSQPNQATDDTATGQAGTLLQEPSPPD